MIITKNKYHVFNFISSPFLDHYNTYSSIWKEKKLIYKSISFILINSKTCLLYTSHCHRTHAILIEDIIPYSQIRFEDILYMLKNREANCFDISHLFYILKKYMTLSSAAYKNICLKNRRKHACIFIVST